MQESIAEAIRSFGISRLQASLGAKLLFRLGPAGGRGKHLSKFEVKVGCVGLHCQRLFVFFLGFSHLPQDKIVFGHGLMSPGRIRISRQESINRLF